MHKAMGQKYKVIDYQSVLSGGKETLGTSGLDESHGGVTSLLGAQLFHPSQ